MNVLEIKKLKENAIIPTRGSEKAAAAGGSGSPEPGAAQGAEDRFRPEKGPCGQTAGGSGRFPPVRQQAGVDGH